MSRKNCAIGRASPPVLSAHSNRLSKWLLFSFTPVQVCTSFRDLASFVPGQLHTNLARNIVDVADSIVPFKGKFAGKFYDAPFSPRIEFPNNPICSQFEDFISSTIIDRFKNGPLIFWGKVGDVQPPHFVMPITVEPTKPRMCHDERLLNLWIKDCPFSLDYLSDLLRYVGSGHFQTACDDKSSRPHLPTSI